MSLFAELRRRNVFRVGAAYAVVAWVIMQVTDLAAPALRLPEWVMSLVLLLLLLGFPIALFLAWAYELTPDGLRRAEEATDAVPDAPGGRYDVAETASEPAAESAAVPAVKSLSIAVIPFINMSEDAEQVRRIDRRLPQGKVRWRANRLGHGHCAVVAWALR